jgi:2-polyprenyl-3-methyl-5-hydroxy-6-metoxy-1,4-benzoquinol methylase
MNGPTASPHSCIVCRSEIAQRLDSALYHCRECGYWTSDFEPMPADASISALNEAHRRAALAGLRSANSQTILGLLGRHASLAGARLCDIGCAYGWFLKAAQDCRAEAMGIEPEAPVADEARREGLQVRNGFFPDCLTDVEQFEIVTFNDVLEHLSEIDLVLEACHRHLVPGGLLSIVIPSSRGSVFRLSCMLSRIGMRRPLDRLWQRDFSCPHVHYFNAANLEALLKRHGFELLHSQDLPSLQLKGLWHRLRMDANARLLPSLAAWACMALLYPLLRVTPSDILCQIYRTTNHNITTSRG